MPCSKKFTAIVNNAVPIAVKRQQRISSVHEAYEFNSPGRFDIEKDPARNPGRRNSIAAQIKRQPINLFPGRLLTSNLDVQILRLGCERRCRSSH